MSSYTVHKDSFANTDWKIILPDITARLKEIGILEQTHNETNLFDDLNEHLAINNTNYLYLHWHLQTFCQVSMCRKHTHTQHTHTQTKTQTDTDTDTHVRTDTDTVMHA
jgi:hypothetical protein